MHYDIFWNIVQVRLHTIALFWIFDFQSLVKFVHFIFIRIFSELFLLDRLALSTDKLLLNFEKENDFRKTNCTKAQKDHSKIKIRNSRLNIWNSSFEIQYSVKPMGWKITNWCSLWAIKCRLTYNWTSN
jgi:hypothetical protein